MEDKLDQIKQKNDIQELENLPEQVEDIEKNPILKPLLDFQKQASMLIKEDKLEHEFLSKIKDELDKDLQTGIYDNSQIVKKFTNLMREYDRLILIYSRYTDLADDKIIEMKHIVEKYYATKKLVLERESLLKKENQLLKDIIKKQNQEIEELREEDEEEEKEEEKLADYEKEFLKPEPEAEEEDKPKVAEKSVEKEDEEESMDEYLNRKLHKTYKDGAQ